MGNKTPPYPAYPAWTEARYYQFLRSALRAAWSKWPPKFDVLKRARRPSQSSNKRLKHEFQCNECKQWFAQKDVAVDHIEPVGTLRSHDDLPTFCQRLFVGVEKLQVLCDGCHARKTALERTQRAET